MCGRMAAVGAWLSLLLWSLGFSGKPAHLYLPTYQRLVRGGDQACRVQAFPWETRNILSLSEHDRETLPPPPPPLLRSCFGGENVKDKAVSHRRERKR